MINFEKLVEKLIFEDVNSANISGVSDISYNFFANTKLKTNKTPYESFNEAYQNFYGKPVFQNISDLNSVLATIRQSADKNQLTIEPFVKYTEAFPVIDFILFVVQTIGNKPKALFNEFEKNLNTVKPDIQEKVVTEYINYFKEHAKKDGWPLDYPAKTVHARMLETGLRKKISENVIGEEALKPYLNDPKSSIYTTVLGLLSARKKIRDPLNLVPTSNKFINEILYGNYEQYAGGGEMVKGKYARLYDEMSVNELMLLARIIREYYKNQCDQFAPENFTTNKLESFVKNQMNKDDKFVFENKFNLNFKRILEAVSNQLTYLSSPINGTKYEITYNPTTKTYLFKNLTNKSITKAPEANVNSVTKSSNFTQNLKTLSNNKQLLQTFTTPTSTTSSSTPTIPTGGYNIKNISVQASSGNESAQKLIDKLKSLGDYIREGEPRDIAGQLTGVMKSATLGAKMVGT